MRRARHFQAQALTHAVGLVAQAAHMPLTPQREATVSYRRDISHAADDADAAEPSHAVE